MHTFKLKYSEKLNEYFPKGHPERILLDEKVEGGDVDYSPRNNSAAVFSHIGDRHFLFSTKKAPANAGGVVWLDYDTFVK